MHACAAMPPSHHIHSITPFSHVLCAQLTCATTSRLTLRSADECFAVQACTPVKLTIRRAIPCLWKLYVKFTTGKCQRSDKHSFDLA